MPTLRLAVHDNTSVENINGRITKKTKAKKGFRCFEYHTKNNETLFGTEEKHKFWKTAEYKARIKLLSETVGNKTIDIDCTAHISITQR